MSWTPVFNIDDSNLSDSEKQQAFDERVFRQTLLNELCSINTQLHLLNARIEEGLETTIDERDVT